MFLFVLKMKSYLKFKRGKRSKPREEELSINRLVKKIKVKLNYQLEFAIQSSLKS